MGINGLAQPSPFQQDATVSDPSSDTLDSEEKKLKGTARERETISMVLEKYNEAMNYRKGYYDDLWEDIDNKFYGLKDDLDMEDVEREYRSNVVMRHAFIQVESMTAKVVNSLLAERTPITHQDPRWT